MVNKIRHNKDIAKYIVNNSDITSVESVEQAEKIVNTVFEAIRFYTKAGCDMSVKDFGRFTCVIRAARNFKTPDGNVIHKNKKNWLVFKPEKSTIQYFNDDVM